MCSKISQISYHFDKLSTRHIPPTPSGHTRTKINAMQHIVQNVYSWDKKSTVISAVCIASALHATQMVKKLSIKTTQYTNLGELDLNHLDPEVLRIKAIHN